MAHPKRIGFLSFGAWHPAGGMTNSAADALHQTVELAVAAEAIGIDGAFVRVHHFARQLSSPYNAAICRQSVSSVDGASSCTAAMAACSW